MELLNENQELIGSISAGGKVIGAMIGQTGPKGENGQNATLEIGSVETIEAGKKATVTNSGTETNAILNFQIPKGADGTLTFEELTEEQKATLKGEKGETGQEGPQGPQGEQGEQGLQGETGRQGLSAYEIAVKNGYVGTEEEWLNSLSKANYYKQYKSTYITTTDNETVIPINIEYYNETTLLEVYINGLRLIENKDYTINIETREITLTKALDVIGTPVHFICSKTSVATENDYDLLRGESAYDVAVKNGYEGTEKQWLTSLKGYSYNRTVDFYTTTTESETTFELSKYSENCLVDVFVNGFLRPSTQYSIQNIDDKYYVVLNNILNTIGTEVQINITEVVNGISEWEQIATYTITEDDFTNNTRTFAFDNFEVRELFVDIQAYPNADAKPGEMTIGINGQSALSSGLILNQSKYGRYAIEISKSPVPGYARMALKSTNNTDTLTGILKDTPKEIFISSKLKMNDKLTKVTLSWWLNTIGVGSIINIYGRK